jgi:hypothetical protein
MILLARTQGVVHGTARADRILDMVERGWSLERLNRSNTFACNGADCQVMLLMSRALTNKETLAIPQLGWAGTFFRPRREGTGKYGARQNPAPASYA